MQDFKTLFSKKLILVSGKGGVGKTFSALYLAAIAEKRGLRPLVVELGNYASVSKYTSAGPIGFDPVALSDSTSAMLNHPNHAVEEFLQRKTHSRFLTEKIVQNKVFKYVFDAAPALPDLVVLGKVWQLVQDAQKNVIQADIIIVDAPATGHGLSLFKIPELAEQALRLGPVAKYAKEIRALLTSEKETGFVIVTIPEEMPVTESIELHEMATDRVGLPYCGTIINRSNSMLKTLDVDSFDQYLEKNAGNTSWPEWARNVASSRSPIIARARTGKAQIERLMNSVPGPYFSLPNFGHMNFSFSDLCSNTDAFQEFK
jgi:anion-transporting  ArsA/GET3 family ATPase